MIVFNYLFYCLYRFFALVKRVGEKDENLVASFYPLLLFTNTLTILIPLRFIFPHGYFKEFPYNLLLKLMLGIPYFIWYFVCKYYFLKKGNHLRIVNDYDKKYTNGFTQPVIVGVTYIIVTFASFITLTFLLSK